MSDMDMMVVDHMPRSSMVPDGEKMLCTPFGEDGNAASTSPGYALWRL